MQQTAYSFYIQDYYYRMLIKRKQTSVSLLVSILQTILNINQEFRGSYRSVENRCIFVLRNKIHVNELYGYIY